MAIVFQRGRGGQEVVIVVSQAVDDAPVEIDADHEAAVREPLRVRVCASPGYRARVLEAALAAGVDHVSLNLDGSASRSSMMTDTSQRPSRPWPVYSR